MDLKTIMEQKCVATNLQLSSKDEILKKIASLAVKSEKLKNVNEELIYQKLKNREELGSTGFGNLIAIPHCRLEEVKNFVVGLVTVEKGIDFDALDGKPVKLFVFIVGPSKESEEHIRILSAISQILAIPGAVKEILKAKTSEAVYENFLRYSNSEIDEAKSTKRQLFKIFIQNEDLLHPVLNILTALKSSSITIHEEENPSIYLNKLSLFSGFWQNDESNHTKIITAVIDKRVTNETVRRIEQTLGNALNDRNDIMIVIQDIFFAAGNLHT